MQKIQDRARGLGVEGVGLSSEEITVELRESLSIAHLQRPWVSVGIDFKMHVSQSVESSVNMRQMTVTFMWNKAQNTNFKHIKGAQILLSLYFIPQKIMYDC